MARTVADYIAQAEQALAAGFTTKTAQAEAKADLNRAYEQMRSEITDACQRVADVFQQNKLNAVYWDLPYYPYQWKPKHAALVREAFGAQFDGLMNRIESTADLHATIKAAPVVKNATPTRQQIEDAAKMTCQCCGRAICANTGQIAHHGYERPGWGWQTASCEGARELPFEASRDALGHYIQRLEAREKLLAYDIAHLDTTGRELTVMITNYDEPRQQWQRLNPLNLTASAETFEAVRAAHPKSTRRCGVPTWEAFKDTIRRQLQASFIGVSQELCAQQARYNGWSQTHSWSALAAQFEEIKS